MIITTRCFKSQRESRPSECASSQGKESHPLPHDNVVQHGTEQYPHWSGYLWCWRRWKLEHGVHKTTSVTKTTISGCGGWRVSCVTSQKDGNGNEEGGDGADSSYSRIFQEFPYPALVERRKRLTKNLRMREISRTFGRLYHRGNLFVNSTSCNWTCSPALTRLNNPRRLSGLASKRPINVSRICYFSSVNSLTWRKQTKISFTTNYLTGSRTWCTIQEKCAIYLAIHIKSTLFTATASDLNIL